MSVAHPRESDTDAFVAPAFVRPASVKFLASPRMAAGLAIIAVAQQLAGNLDCDVSWFITFAENFIDGRVPYVEVADPNPPAAFLVLVPAVAIARMLHVAAEPIVGAFVFVLAGLSIAFSFYLLRRGAPRSREEWGLICNGSIYLLLVAPEIVFGEREHLALLSMAPALALMAASGNAPFAARVAAGLGAGLAISLKPYFALAIALPALAIAWRERSPRILFGVEMWTALVSSMLYLGAVAVFFPAYFSNALPAIIDVYAPARDGLQNFFLHTLAPVYAALLLGLVVAARGLPSSLASLVSAMASLGFFASFVIQGKGWINHAYPGVALILLAWLFLALEDLPEAPFSRTAERLLKFLFVPALFAAPAFFGAATQLTDAEEHPGLRDAVERLAPAQPRMIAMARQLDFGHPVVRQVGGVWVGRQNALWTSSFVAQLLPLTSDPARRVRLETYRREDLAAFAEDVRNGRPDVIVAEDATTREFVSNQPETSGVLDSYERAGMVREIEIWVRKVN